MYTAIHSSMTLMNLFIIKTIEDYLVKLDCIKSFPSLYGNKMHEHNWILFN